MTGNEVTQVVDALAEKLGMAADKLQPIAEETVRQVTLSGKIGCAFGLALCAIALFLGLLIPIVIKKECLDNEDLVIPLLGLCTFGALLVGGLAIYSGLVRWLAPLPHLLGL